jgi:hypothetical protein
LTTPRRRWGGRGEGGRWGGLLCSARVSGRPGRGRARRPSVLVATGRLRGAPAAARPKRASCGAHRWRHCSSPEARSCSRAVPAQERAGTCRGPVTRTRALTQTPSHPPFPTLLRPKIPRPRAGRHAEPPADGRRRLRHQRVARPRARVVPQAAGRGVRRLRVVRAWAGGVARCAGCFGGPCECCAGRRGPGGRRCRAARAASRLWQRRPAGWRERVTRARKTPLVLISSTHGRRLPLRAATPACATS